MKGHMHKHVSSAEHGSAMTNDAMMADLHNVYAEDVKQRLMLNIKCSNLPKLDKGSNSDPFVVLYAETMAGDQYIGRTDTVIDSLNPDFVHGIEVDFYFEEEQRFRFDLYDQDDATQDDLQFQDKIGSFRFRIADVISRRDQTLADGEIEPDNA